MENHALVFEVNNISYQYAGQVPSLDQISLEVRQGEKLAILGSNGSGKSTLLKILDGLYFPDSGSVKAFGQLLNEKSLQDERFNEAFRSKVGFVFQDSDVQLFMPSVWDELAFAPLQMGIDQDEVKRRVTAALQALQIEKLKERAPHQISGGEKKRVALASILTLAPEVWLLDEPSAGLDPRSVTWLTRFINEQGHAGKTVVLATHDLSLVEATADRVYILDEDHHIIATGAPRQILSDSSLLVKSNLLSI
jgi:cobalt/nickel transport system ATP-binding protein